MTDSSASGASAATLPIRVLCIGAGFGGLEIMRMLGSDERFQLAVVDRQNHHTFQPLLYQVATASLAMPAISRTVREIAAKHANIEFFQDEIRDFDLDGRAAIGRSGRRYAYDRLVLAAGARTGFFGNDHWGEHSFGLKSLYEAYQLRRQLIIALEKAELTDDSDERAKLMTIAIVGGGPTGVELAGAIEDLVKRNMARGFRRIDPDKLRVILIQGPDRLLPPFPPEQGAYAKRRLERHGVEVCLESRVVDIQHEKLTLKDGRELRAGTIIWAAGVEASGLTRKLGVEPTDRAGRIRPEPDLSLPGRPEVFLVGDVVGMKDANGVEVPGLAPAAIQMAEWVAKHLQEDARCIADGRRVKAAAERSPFIYRDKGIMAIIGRQAAVVKTANMEIEGPLAWLIWLFVHLMSLVGFRNRVAVLANWFVAYVHNRSGAQVVAVDDTDYTDPGNPDSAL